MHHPTPQNAWYMGVVDFACFVLPPIVAKAVWCAGVDSFIVASALAGYYVLVLQFSLPALKKFN